MNESHHQIETNRLILRRLNQHDFIDLEEMLYDVDVTKAWESTFTKVQIQEWLDYQLNNYQKYGFGVFAVINKITGETIGQIGPDWTNINGKAKLELAWMLKKAHWHNGFATESASGCISYLFNQLGYDKIYMSIRPENIASIKVAERLGAKVEGEYIKKYKDKEMNHLIYTLYK